MQEHALRRWKYKFEVWGWGEQEKLPPAAPSYSSWGFFGKTVKQTSYWGLQEFRFWVFMNTFWNVPDGDTSFLRACYSLGTQGARKHTCLRQEGEEEGCSPAGHCSRRRAVSSQGGSGCPRGQAEDSTAGLRALLL